MGGTTTKLPRKGILMVVKITCTGRLRTRPIATAWTPALPDEPLDQFNKHVQEIVRCFQSEPVTTQRFFELEKQLNIAANNACRQILEQEANRLEPEDKGMLPGRVRYRQEMYRINK